MSISKELKVLIETQFSKYWETLEEYVGHCSPELNRNIAYKIYEDAYLQSLRDWNHGEWLNNFLYKKED